MGYLQRIHHGESSIDFPKLWRPAIAVSGALVLLGIASFFVRGINWSIEFEGGTLWEVKAPGVSVSDARDFLRPLGEGEAKIQIVGGDTLRIQSQLKDPTRANEVKVELEQLGTVDTVNSVGPTWGGEITDKAVRALVIFFVLLAIYIWWRLEWRMAIGAMVAVIHDVVLSVAVYSIFNLLVSPATVVSFLTILGYSLYDTVVVFDKSHELTARPGVVSRYSYTDIMNLSLNQVITRSVGTTLVGVLPVFTMYVVGSVALGASTLQEFSLALLVGLIAGAYSSVFVAAPIVTYLKEREPRHRDVRIRLEQRGLAEAGGTVMLDARELSGLASARPQKRGSFKPTGATKAPGKPSTTKASAGKASTGKATDDSAAGDTAADSAPARSAPAGVIPPRPRKKKRR
ncbi:MAG: protein translocase subunit SecF [Acidimicrobiales bacterium]